MLDKDPEGRSGRKQVAGDDTITNIGQETSRSNAVSLEDHIENLIRKQDVLLILELLNL